MFKSKTDGDHVAMPAPIRKGGKLLYANHRADMPGFVCKSTVTAFDRG